MQADNITKKIENYLLTKVNLFLCLVLITKIINIFILSAFVI